MNLRSLYAIARGAFFEIVRLPAFSIVLTLILAACALGPRLVLFGLGGASQLLADFGVSSILLGSWLVVGLGSAAVVESEIRLRTALTLLAKPVSRGVFLSGKFCGLVAALALFFVVTTIGLLFAAREGPPVSARHESDWPSLLAAGTALFAAVGFALERFLRRGRRFSASFSVAAGLAFPLAIAVAAAFDRDGSWQSYGAGYDGLLAAAACLAFGAALVLAAAAVAVSSWLSAGATLLFTGGLFVAGLSLAAWSPSIRRFCFFLPDFRVFWSGDLFYLEEPSLPLGYLGGSLLYGAAFATFYLAAGVVAFGRKGF